MREAGRITPQQAHQRLESGQPIVFVDARTPDDWDRADRKIANAIRRPPAEVENHLTGFPQGRPVITYCSTPGDRTAFRAAAALMENGWHDVHVLEGGLIAWERAGLPTIAKVSETSGCGKPHR